MKHFVYKVHPSGDKQLIRLYDDDLDGSDITYDYTQNPVICSVYDGSGTTIIYEGETEVGRTVQLGSYNTIEGHIKEYEHQQLVSESYTTVTDDERVMVQYHKGVLVYKSTEFIHKKENVHEKYEGGSLIEKSIQSMVNSNTSVQHYFNGEGELVNIEHTIYNEYNQILSYKYEDARGETIISYTNIWQDGLLVAIHAYNQKEGHNFIEFLYNEYEDITSVKIRNTAGEVTGQMVIEYNGMYMTSEKGFVSNTLALGHLSDYIPDNGEPFHFLHEYEAETHDDAEDLDF